MRCKIRFASMTSYKINNQKAFSGSSLLKADNFNGTNNHNKSTTMPAGNSFLANFGKKKTSTLIHNNQPQPTEFEFIDVKIVFPNGDQCFQQIDTKWAFFFWKNYCLFHYFYYTFLFLNLRKAVYDLLIELSGAARLIPTNYTLKLYNDADDKYENDINKIIEYTPNQKIGQLSKSIILVIQQKCNFSIFLFSRSSQD